MRKISIRFFNDREVRAIWDEANSKWWFSVVDIVAAITDSPNPRKYWSVLKTRLKKAGNELTTNCSQLKLTAADSCLYLRGLYDFAGQIRNKTISKGGFTLCLAEYLHPDINWLSELYKGDERPVKIMRLDYSSNSQDNQALAKLKLLQDD